MLLYPFPPPEKWRENGLFQPDGQFLFSVARGPQTPICGGGHKKALR